MGRFITFEGIDGTGKSRQSSLLTQNLEKSGLSVIATREPGGTPGAELARHLLKTGAIGMYGAFAEALVLSVARSDHLIQVIHPALAEGHWVVCDRFIDSTTAYQGAGNGVDASVLARFAEIIGGHLKPDLTFIFDIPLAVATSRIAQRRGLCVIKDRFEKEPSEFHKRVQEAFQTIAKNDPERCIVIDSTAKPEYIARNILDTITRRFGLKE